jgi:hypothetical protein
VIAGFWYKVNGARQIKKRKQLSPVDISEIGMLCGQASCIGEYDGYIKAKNNERKSKRKN